MAKRNPTKNDPQIAEPSEVETTEIESEESIGANDELLISDEKLAESDVEALSDDDLDTSSAAVEDLDDDELALQMKDEIVELSDDLGVFKQNDDMIAWSIHNFYQENGEVRSKRELRNDPPTLRIENAKGDAVDFILSKQFTKTLYEALENVHYGMFGIKKSKSRWTNFKDALMGSILENPLKVIVLTLLTALVIVILVVS